MATSPLEEHLAAVTAGFGLGTPAAVRRVTTGLMNRNWQVTTATGTYAIKQIVDVDPGRMRRQHQVTAALAALGAPVPAALSTADGRTVLQLPSGAYTATAWTDGVHREGRKLSLAQSADFGLLLGRLHRLLSEVCPASPATASVTAQPPRDVLTAVDDYLARIARLPRRNEFDDVAWGCLRQRRTLLSRHATTRPDLTFDATAGWTHGDFHDLNVLWRDDAVSAVVDWDRLRVQGYVFELLRAALYTFGRDGTLDLARVAAFVAGYRDVVPLDDTEIATGAHHFWWRKLSNLWPLDWHYDRGDDSCDHLFAPTSAVIWWWYDHREAVTAAFTGRL